ncbi:MAG: DUF4956 domain-containing protein [bacterium]|nr:DUF4956 domain-containing protein [bacterium]
MPDWSQLTQPAPLSVPGVLVNLALGMVLGLLIGWHFARFGRTMGNRASLARVLTAIVLTTILVISVVKASLALSLGLVGALSIVRFRTPIKEPEELAYLFLAIATGLALGADQRLVVLAAVPAILFLMAAHARFADRKRKHNLYLNVEMPSGDTGQDLFPGLARAVADHSAAADVRRVDVGDGLLQATFSIDCRDDTQLFDVVGTLRDDYPSATVSVVDQSHGLEG